MDNAYVRVPHHSSDAFLNNACLAFLYRASGRSGLGRSPPSRNNHSKMSMSCLAALTSDVNDNGKYEVVSLQDCRHGAACNTVCLCDLARTWTNMSWTSMIGTVPALKACKYFSVVPEDMQGQGIIL